MSHSLQKQLTIATQGAGLYEITQAARSFLAGTPTTASCGLLTVFIQHTSCSLLIQENADPDVRRDLDAFFARLVPPADDPSMTYLQHQLEGPDDMPAHIKAALTATSLAIPVNQGQLLLGQWQGLYLFEHRSAPHRRSVVLHLSG
ncbi:MAG: secondary thiamine-phosphate synthase enzyme YjbQ [Pseudomonadota bacterium]